MISKERRETGTEGRFMRRDVTVTVHVNFRCIYFRLKMVVRPKHVANNLNKIVKNYWNRVPLDGNPSTWSKSLRLLCRFSILAALVRSQARTWGIFGWAEWHYPVFLPVSRITSSHSNDAHQSRNSSMYRQAIGWKAEVSFTVRVSDFSFLHSVHVGTHPTSSGLCLWG
jgi:hypothetical protein